MKINSFFGIIQEWIKGTLPIGLISNGDGTRGNCQKLNLFIPLRKSLQNRSLLAWVGE